MPQHRIPLEPERMYHIWTHANGSDDLFRCDENYRYFLEKYTMHVYPVVETFAYCLMPNHLHLMIQVRDQGTLHEVRTKKTLQNRNLQSVETLEGSKTLQGFKTLGGFGPLVSKRFSNLFNSYAQSYNAMYNRKGSLFIPNFGRKLIDSDTYFTALISYIHNNAVHHGFVKSPDNWPYSSWHAYLNNKATKINKQVGLQWFGGLQEFIDFHQKMADSNQYPELI